MRLFQALANMWRGFVSLFIKGVAVSNPEVAYEGIIQQRLEERERLVSAAGVLFGERNKRAAELKRVEEEHARNERELKAAISRNTPQVGQLLIQKKHALDRRLGDLRPQVANLEEQAKRVRGDVERFNRSIIELKEKAKINVARLRAAQAQKRIMSMIDGLSIRGDEQMVQAVDDAIESTIGDVQVRQEIDGTNVERQLADVQEVAAKGAAEDEFAQMRAQFEQAQGVAPAGGSTPTDGGKQA